MGLYLLGQEGGRERKGGTKRGDTSCRELTEDQAIPCCVTYKIKNVFYLETEIIAV